MAQKNIILTNGNITETTYNDEKIDGLVLFENIKDANGNNRFIEGNLSAHTIAGVTWNYQKWSLSGSHLMIVLAGVVENNTTITENTELILFQLPTFINNKIYTILSDIVTFKQEISVDAYTRTKTFNVQLAKSGGGYYRIFFKSNTTFNTGLNSAFRIQFDLLIDND